MGSFVLFPVLQWRWRDDELYSEVIPQLAYGIEGKKKERYCGDIPVHRYIILFRSSFNYGSSGCAVTFSFLKTAEDYKTIAQITKNKKHRRTQVRPWCDHENRIL